MNKVLIIKNNDKNNDFYKHAEVSFTNNEKNIIIP